MIHGVFSPHNQDIIICVLCASIRLFGPDCNNSPEFLVRPFTDRCFDDVSCGFGMYNFRNFLFDYILERN